MIANDSLDTIISNTKMNEEDRATIYDEIDKIILSWSSDEDRHQHKEPYEKVLSFLEDTLCAASQGVRSGLKECELRTKSLLTKTEAVCEASTSSFLEQQNSMRGGDYNDSLNDLFGNMKSLLSFQGKSAELQELHDEANSMAQKCLKMQTSLIENKTFYQAVAAHIEASFDVSIKDRANAMIGQHLGSLIDCNPIVSSTILALSDVYEIIRTLEERAKTNSMTSSTKWEAPASFERTTSKYWIQDNMLPSVLTRIVQEAPLLVYGHQGMITSSEEFDVSTSLADPDKLWDVLATPVSSVYFDSPNMDMYRERIARREGAQLFRVRWYGTSKPTGSQCVFLELKTHHEKWINNKSVKERVTIQEQDVKHFLAREYWNHGTPLARDIVIRGNPKLSGKDHDKQIALICTMHNLVIHMDLHPCVRSRYQRAAFQSPESNSLRLTVDRNVSVIDETRPSGNVVDWCLSDEDAEDPCRVKVVPYSIFEVKLAGVEMPSSIQSLVDDAQSLLDAYKFSKFLTGAASFQQEKIKTLPYWADNENFQSMFANDANVGQALEEVVSAVSRTERTSSFTTSDSNLDGSTQEDVKKPPENKRHPPSLPGFKSIQTPSKNSSSARFRHRSSSSAFFRGSSHRLSSLEPEAVERGCCLPGLGGGSNHSEKNKNVAPKKAVRVEPKSYFANERTFIQWISAALLLVTVAAIIADYDATYPHMYPVSLFLMGCAVFVVVYSMYVYYRRVKLMQSGAPYGYIDRMGPLLLATAVIVGVIILLTNTVKSETGSMRQTYLVSDDDNSECYQHAMEGINRFTYQPSGVLVDTDHQMLLIPSLNTISGVPLADEAGVWPSGDVRELLTMSDGRVDFEAIFYAGDRLFAASEGEIKNSGEIKRSQLVELEWTIDSTSAPKLKAVQTYWLHSSLSEGATFIDGEVWIVDNNVHETKQDQYLNGGIQVFNLPDRIKDSNTTKEEHLNPTRPLSRRVTSEGLDGDTKIGALTYFEDKLYVLHDNLQLVRVWDPRKGELLEEIKLPAAEVGAEQQWEGFALERRTVAAAAAATNLRSGGDSSVSAESRLYMHLALDSPPQLWSIEVSENEEGHIVFPSCAARRRKQSP